jgi:hypothetical protein
MFENARVSVLRNRLACIKKVGQEIKTITSVV